MQNQSCQRIKVISRQLQGHISPTLLLGVNMFLMVNASKVSDHHCRHQEKMEKRNGLNLSDHLLSPPTTGHGTRGHDFTHHEEVINRNINNRISRGHREDNFLDQDSTPQGLCISVTRILGKLQGSINQCKAQQPPTPPTMTMSTTSPQLTTPPKRTT